MAGYELVKEIGRGGMGCVYEGRSPDGRKVAIKMMSSKMTVNPEFKELFYREAEALRKMHNPAVVSIVDNPFSDSTGNLYLPMEFVGGQTIEQLVGAKGHFSEAEAKDLMGKILDAMAYIHGMGCIHRDIKPSNIMVRGDGSICIIDFGIAKDMKTHTGKTIGLIIGTDGYMSPEQAGGISIDHRTDIYSLGCLLFYMVTGTNAIQKKSNDYETVCAILNNDFPDPKMYNPQLSDHLRDVILKAVDKNMLHRYQTAMEFRQALNGDSKDQQGPTIYETPIASDRVIVTIGRSPDCDYVVQGNYVSGHHAEIEYKAIPNTERVHYQFVFRDHSTNGTSVDGRYVHHDECSIPAPLFYEGGITTYQEVPIWLAGREEYRLDFLRLVDMLYAKWKSVQSQPVVPATPSQPTAHGGGTTVGKEKIGVIGIICCIIGFLFPIIALILWLVWRKSKPYRAQHIAKWGSIGFIVNIIWFQLSRFF